MADRMVARHVYSQNKSFGRLVSKRFFVDTNPKILPCKNSSKKLVFQGVQGVSLLAAVGVLEGVESNKTLRLSIQVVPFVDLGVLSMTW
jgi:hypothetical protein